MKAVILAAGEGTRLNKGWTIVPKPLLEVGDKTIIEHVILNLKEAGFNEFVVVIGFMSEHIKDHLRNGIEHGVNIKYVFNKNYKDDMITSLLSVKDHIQGPFLLCMADLFFNGKVITKFLENNKEQINQDNFVLVDSKLNQIKRIEEKFKVQTMGNNLLHASLVLPTYNAVDSGIYYLQNSIFPFIEKCFAEGKKSLPMVITELAIQGKFKVHNIENDEVVDIDREKDIQYISEIFLSNSKENKNA